jgi:c-di-GMP-related signal transduction protein
MTISIAKSAIYDRNKKIIAYELLYRNSEENSCLNIDDSIATLGVINTIFRVGLNSITQGKLGFINLSKPFIKYEILKLLPKDKIGIEILEDVEPDSEIIDACLKLKKEGYIIALDDFILTNPINPLVEIADIIKIDFLKYSFEERNDIINKVGINRVKFLAEKVETYNDYQQAKNAGYSYFQGYYFSKPELMIYEEF